MLLLSCTFIFDCLLCCRVARCYKYNTSSLIICFVMVIILFTIKISNLLITNYKYETVTHVIISPCLVDAHNAHSLQQLWPIDLFIPVYVMVICVYMM